jgi:hypothetical protein
MRWPRSGSSSATARYQPPTCIGSSAGHNSRSSRSTAPGASWESVPSRQGRDRGCWNWPRKLLKSPKGATRISCQTHGNPRQSRTSRHMTTAVTQSNPAISRPCLVPFAWYAIATRSPRLLSRFARSPFGRTLPSGSASAGSRGRLPQWYDVARARMRRVRQRLRPWLIPPTRALGFGLPPGGRGVCVHPGGRECTG